MTVMRATGADLEHALGDMTGWDDYHLWVDGAIAARLTLERGLREPKWVGQDAPDVVHTGQGIEPLADLIDGERDPETLLVRLLAGRWGIVPTKHGQGL